MRLHIAKDVQNVCNEKKNIVVAKLKYLVYTHM